jgi:hypothetical protein
MTECVGHKSNFVITLVCAYLSFTFFLAQAVRLEILLAVSQIICFILLIVQQVKNTFIKEHCNGQLLGVCVCVCLCVLNHDCMINLQLYH